MRKKVAVIMGSDSDWGTVKKAVAVLKEYGVPVEAHVMSAHRTPAEAASFAASAKQNGFGVIIAAAGMAAHLAGVLAAHTTLPDQVCGVRRNGCAAGYRDDAEGRSRGDGSSRRRRQCGISGGSNLSPFR